MRNPSLESVEKGDSFVGGHSGTLNHGFAYESHVLKVGEMGMRFGQPDRIITVCVRSINMDGSVRHEELGWMRLHGFKQVLDLSNVHLVDA